MGTTARRIARFARRPVHPHARGDDAGKDTYFATLNGSPPRPWGRPIPLPTQLRRVRFTPTPVGTTTRESPRTVAAAVHPHARGDDPLTWLWTAACIGSPPRPWGRQPARIGQARRQRFTPTPVGTTDALALGCQRVAVHPHARGDDYPGRRGRYRDAVHPHARGDDWVKPWAIANYFGSPPRPWGRRSSTCPRGAITRFTPTPVGTSYTSDLMFAVLAVHPHARGDDAIQLIPRLVELWFTPTPVGTTPSARRWRARMTVHPHARGDDGDEDTKQRGKGGSPPRPWGRPPAGTARTLAVLNVN